MMEFVIFGKTITSNEKIVLGNLWVFYESVENNLIVSELDFGIEKQCRRRRRMQQTIGKDDNVSGVPKKTMAIDDELKRPAVNWHPCTTKVFFGRKTVPAIKAPVISRQRKSIWNVLLEKQELKLLKTQMKA